MMRTPTYAAALWLIGCGAALIAFGLLAGTDAAYVGGIVLGASIGGGGLFHALDVWRARRAIARARDVAAERLADRYRRRLPRGEESHAPRVADR